jgi:hypothetical protein
MTKVFTAVLICSLMLLVVPANAMTPHQYLVHHLMHPSLIAISGLCIMLGTALFIADMRGDAKAAFYASALMAFGAC